MDKVQYWLYYNFYRTCTKARLLQMRTSIETYGDETIDETVYVVEPKWFWKK